MESLSRMLTEDSLIFAHPISILVLLLYRCLGLLSFGLVGMDSMEAGMSKEKQKGVIDILLRF